MGGRQQAGGCAVATPGPVASSPRPLRRSLAPGVPAGEAGMETGASSKEGRARAWRVRCCPLPHGRPQYNRQTPAHSPHQAFNGCKQAQRGCRGGVSKPRGSWRMVPCRLPAGAPRLEEQEDPGWGGWSRGEHAKLISAISLLRTTLAGSHLAPPRQNQPLCLASGSWPGSERAPCPIPSPFAGPGLPGGTRAGWQGVLPATGCQNLRRARKATSTLPGKEVFPLPNCSGRN